RRHGPIIKNAARRIRRLRAQHPRRQQQRHRTHDEALPKPYARSIQSPTHHKGLRLCGTGVQPVFSLNKHGLKTRATKSNDFQISTTRRSLRGKPQEVPRLSPNQNPRTCSIEKTSVAIRYCGVKQKSASISSSATRKDLLRVILKMSVRPRQVGPASRAGLRCEAPKTPALRVSGARLTAPTRHSGRLRQVGPASRAGLRGEAPKRPASRVSAARLAAPTRYSGEGWGQGFPVKWERTLSSSWVRGHFREQRNSTHPRFAPHPNPPR